MKRYLLVAILLSIGIIFSLINISCQEETIDTVPPPELYEFGTTVGDGCVYLNWNFPGLENHKYGIEVTYYLNEVQKVQSAFGVSNMTISGLTNNVSYKFTLVTTDEAGNKTEGFDFIAIPNTPFIIVSPTSNDAYIVENGKIRINVRFNRLADTTQDYEIFGGWYLYTDASEVEHSITWPENGMVLSILTDETKETFCPNLPCDLYLKFRFPWMGATWFYGIQDLNGMLLDANKDGKEMGEAEMKFVIE